MAVSTPLFLLYSDILSQYNHNHWNRQLTRAVASLNSSTHSGLKTAFNPIRCSSIDQTSTSLSGFSFWIFKRNRRRFFFPSSSADIWFLVFWTRNSQSKLHGLEIFPPYADERLFHPWVHSSSRQLYDHSTARHRGVGAVRLTTTIAGSTLFSRGSQSVFL